jgi:2-amino-4-hydroxy-6-hydroxymethyldihydropteridine diphosphokinase
MWTPVYVGVGSNLDAPLQQVRRAIQLLGDTGKIASLHCSAPVESQPVGFIEQPRFINAVVGFLTQWSLIECHNTLKAIETRMGKVPPKERFGPRIIDLDVLIFGSTISTDPSLILPHPRLHERAFVLYPLAQIAPQLLVPGLGSVAKLLQALPPAASEGMVELGHSLMAR